MRPREVTQHARGTQLTRGKAKFPTQVTDSRATLLNGTNRGWVAALNTATCLVQVARSQAELFPGQSRPGSTATGQSHGQVLQTFKSISPHASVSLSSHPSNLKQEDIVKAQPCNPFPNQLPSSTPDQDLSSSGK